VSCSTKTTDEHPAPAFANDLFNNTLVEAASGQEVNSKKTPHARHQPQSAELIKNLQSFGGAQ
jgi:hypothetical protein